MATLSQTLRTVFGESRLHNDLLSEKASTAYIPGLNGIRALAVLIVLFAHFEITSLIPGGFGVTVFFFISGFLITRLLLAETDKDGHIHLPNFYVRRLIRLYPALLFMVLGSSVVFIVCGFSGPTAPQLLAAVTYLTNVFQVYDADHNMGWVIMSWTHLWSLAVEEHFYLLFPLLIVLLKPTKNRFLSLLLFLLILIPTWRLIKFNGSGNSAELYSYMMTDARIDSIIWGCVLSVVLNRVKSVRNLSFLIGAVPILLAVGGLLLSFLYRDDMFRQVLRYSVQGGALFVLVLNLYYFKALQFCVSVLEWSALAWIGKVSYALYLWHYPILDFAQRTLGKSILSYTLAFILSFVFAAVSYSYVEKPFMKLRKRFGSAGIG